MDEKSPPASKPTRLGYGPVAAILVTIGSYLTSQLIAGAVLSLVPMLWGWKAPRIETWLDRSVVAQFLAVFLIEATTMFILWTFISRRRVRLRLLGIIRPRGKDILPALIGYGAYFLSFVFVTQIVSQFVTNLDLEQKQELGFNTSTGGPALMLVFLSLVVLPAVVEEFMFRGFLYAGLRRLLPSLGAALVTGLIFATAHLQFGTGNALLWVAFIDTFVLSMILTFLREKTGSLWPPIMVHLIKNTIAFTFLFIIKIPSLV